MKICVLGSGSWGFTLQMLLASKGYDIIAWTGKEKLRDQLNNNRIHPLFPNSPIPLNITFTCDLEDAAYNKEMIVESVTSSGLRPVFERIKHEPINCPIVITSKGVEQSSLLSLPDVLVDVLGERHRKKISILSGPSFAQDVIHQRPTSVVASSFNPQAIPLISQTFNTPTFRVYPNSDIQGVSLGGAMKNIMAIACGISDGMQFGASARAALMTRGLHEMRKVAVACGAKAETLNGLSGMGDLIATCSSTLSRNYSFGTLLAEGKSSDEALDQIGLVVEGTYSVKSITTLGEKLGIPLPVSEGVYGMIYKNLSPQMAVQQLMQRQVKEEHL
ncbi:NAD(P)-dependent glycerol-3-phosphate dehydrogenase [Chlamydiales bacterium]|nr:NAD(P)-dependent glycerol-3-phosphate dehydrogenase [Chlamydiales bacterium]